MTHSLNTIYTYYICISYTFFTLFYNIIIHLPYAYAYTCYYAYTGLVADRNLTLGNLIALIRTFFEKIGITEIRFKPAYNPYTEPSMEVYIYCTAYSLCTILYCTVMFLHIMYLTVYAHKLEL